MLISVSFLNTPHNPIGKVFDVEELREIGRIAEEHNLIILADEVVRLILLSIVPSLSTDTYIKTIV